MLNRPTLADAAGFSLVELMIAVTVGLVLLAGVVGIFTNNIKSNSDTLKATRLNQELRAVMDVMARDIQRTGYWSEATEPTTGAVQSVTNPFTSGANDLQISGACITYTYDGNDGNNDADDNEKFAFFLRNSAVGMRKGGSSASNSCTPSSWESITDPALVTITALNFGLVTGCINITDIPPSDCGAVAPASGDTLVMVRRVDITLSGQLANDANVQRTLSESVRVRNDLVTLAP